MSTGIKKLQRVQFGKEATPGTGVSANAIWRGTGNQLDDQRTVNQVEELIGILSDTTRTNISKWMGAITLNSCNATYEQLPILFAAAVGGPTVGAFDITGGGSGGAMTATLTTGSVSAITVTNGGTGYTTAPTLLLYGGQPTAVATATCTVTAGVIQTPVTVTSGGTGYVTPPSILIIPAGAGSDGIYQSTLPVGTAPSLTAASMSIWGGDNFETEQLNDAVCTKIELSGEGGGEVKVSAEFLGNYIQTGSGFGTRGVFPDPVEDILFQKMTVFLDTTGGTFGTTQVSKAVIGFKVTFEFKWAPIFTADNIMYFSNLNFTGWTASGQITFLQDVAVTGGGSGIKALFRNQSARLLRLNFTGGNLAQAGTVYSTKTLIIDLPLTFSKVDPLGEKDGTSIVNVSFRAGYNATAGVAGKVIIVSDQRVLTGITP